MSLHINNNEADRLVAELIAATGESKTEAVVKSMQERLEKIRKTTPDNFVREDIWSLVEQFNSYPLRDTRTDDDILGFNV